MNIAQLLQDFTLKMQGREGGVVFAGHYGNTWFQAPACGWLGYLMKITAAGTGQGPR